MTYNLTPEKVPWLHHTNPGSLSKPWQRCQIDVCLKTLHFALELRG